MKKPDDWIIYHFASRRILDLRDKADSITYSTLPRDDIFYDFAEDYYFTKASGGLSNSLDIVVKVGEADISWERTHTANGNQYK